VQPRGIEQIRPARAGRLLMRRNHCFARPKRVHSVERDGVLGANPHQVLDLVDPAMGILGRACPPQGGLGKAEEIAVELDRNRYSAMNAATQQPERARGLTMDDVEPSLHMQGLECISRPADPVAVAHRTARPRPWNAEEVPRRAVAFLEGEPTRMKGRYRLDLVPGGDEPSAEIRGMSLHASKPVRVTRNRNDADFHAMGSLTG
jgi:hypothetical protein